MTNRISIVYLIILSSVIQISAQQEITLLGVYVDGNKLASETMIRYTAGLRQNEVINVADFSRAVKRLWQLGLFEDVQIKIDKETPDGFFITIQVQETPILGTVHYKGNKKLKDKQLQDELEFYLGQRIKPHVLIESITKLKDFYAEDGFLLAEVEATLVDPEGTIDDQKSDKDKQKQELTKDILFTIEENDKVKINKILFQGNESYSGFHLRRVLKETKQQRWYLFWRSYFDGKKFNEDKLALETFYRNNGYRDFTILSDTTEVNDEKKRMDIIISVIEGPRYRYRNFSWDGNTLFNNEILNRALNLKRGDYFNEEEFNEAVYNNMQGLYMDRGYIYSRVEPQFTPVDEDSLDIHFPIVENHQISVRNISIAGNDHTRENIIRRELNIYPGDIFNREMLIRSQRNLLRLNYFSNVVPDVAPVDEDEVDLEITVEEKSADRANANMGYSGIYGLSGGVGVEFANFRGLGQQFMISYNIGSKYNFYSSQPTSQFKSFSMSFVDPMIFDTPNRVGFSFYSTFRGQGTSYYFPLDLRMVGGSVQWGRRFKWPDDYFRGYWVLRAMKKTYEGTQEELDQYVKGLSTTLGNSITQVVTRDNRDHHEFPTRGSKFTWESTFSGNILGGNEDFFKHILNFEWFSPTFWKFVLTSSFKIGVIQPLENLDNQRSIIPFDEKFIMGGNGMPYGNMLRGYPDNSISPGPTGGNALLRSVTEFRVPISENPVIYGLAFAEMGNVWNTVNMTESFDIPRDGAFSLKRSAGIGIRFYMPMMGVLGFDMGYGFDVIDNTGEKPGWNYTIIFGNVF
jgi:outer membrane protein insertion porin family